ncbi:MAG: hypothetical protein DWQ04_11535 [Chloroflexi bacterium]|nr:MAG: hypothetical protein DWQ04_11535 [Chloroflexota bacterium]
MQSLNKLNVYLASPLFNVAERRFNLEIKALLVELGFDTFIPQEDSGLIDEFIKQGMDLHQARDQIFQQNHRAIENADIVLFVLDGRVPDEGACIESGLAFALDKECIGVQTDFRMVEPGGNNLMIDGVLNYRIANNLEELRILLISTRDKILQTANKHSYRQPYVVVTGSIGVGKTAFVNLVGKNLDWQTIEEPIEANPYLEEVYQDLNGLAFRVQAFYMGLRTKQHMNVLDLRRPAIQDRGIYEDTEVFAKTYHQMDAFDVTDLSTLQTLYHTFAELLPRPDLLVYVHAPFDMQLARIRQRGREFENSLDTSFLQKLNSNYEFWIARQKWAPVLQIDSAKMDYVNNGADQQNAINLLLNHLQDVRKQSPSLAAERLLLRPFDQPTRRETGLSA